MNLPGKPEAEDYAVDSNQRLNHAPLFGGAIYYVSKSGDNDNDGTSPDSPLLTITAGIAATSAGDAVSVKAGTYDENGLDLALDGVELWGEIGVLINNTNPGTCLTVSGATCRVRGVAVSQAGQIGFAVTGAGCTLEDCVSTDNTVAYDVDGVRCTFVRCKDQNATVTGFDIATKENLLYLCNSLGDSASRGFYLSNAAADNNMIHQCLSSGNTTTGYEVVTGATGNAFAYCTSGGGDGHRVDAGTRTQWAQFIGHSPRERHEESYPFSDGEGVSGLPIAVTTNAQDETNGAATTQDYWGEPKVIMPVTTITDDFNLCGYHLYGTTTNKAIAFTLYRINYTIGSDKNGGNAWDEGATALTVDDGSNFQTDDLVWIYSDYKINGEIVRVTNVSTNVVTVARETSQFGAPNTGLRWDHTTNDAGTEVMYLVYRASSDGMHGIEGQWSCASSKAFFTRNLHTCKELRANDGILIRSQNMTDGTNGTAFDVAIIFED
jgi:hypothetical protein